MSRPEVSQADIDAMTPKELAHAQIGGGSGKRQRRTGMVPGQSKLPAEAQSQVDAARAASKKSSGPDDD